MIEHYQNELKESQFKLAKCQIDLIDLQTLALAGANNKTKRKWLEKAITNYKYKIQKIEELIAEQEGALYAS